MDLFKLKGVEIFKAGTWNGDAYSVKDLDDMVAAFDHVGFKPPVKLGHKESSGAPAFGWIENLRRQGDKLVADFHDLPEAVFKAIKSRAFDTVSSEVFWNIKRGGKNFRRALKAVALLGAEIPAVSDLMPLRNNFSIDDVDFASLQVYQLSNEDMHQQISNIEDDNHDEDSKVNKFGEFLKSIISADKFEATIATLAQAMGIDVAGMNAYMHTALKPTPDQMKAIAASLQIDESRLTQYAMSIPGAATGDGNNAQVSELSQRLEDQQLAIDKANNEKRDLAKTVAKLHQDQKNKEIRLVADSCRIPAFREHLYALLSELPDGEGAKAYSFGEGDAKKELSAFKACEDLIGMLNKHAEKLFKESASGGTDLPDGTDADNIGDQVDAKVKAHMEANKTDDYQAALTAVLDKNPDLARAYAQS